MSTDIAKKVTDYFSKFPLRKYPKGQILIYAGEMPERIYFIKKGTVRQYDISHRGDALVVNVFKPGAFFPMSTVINNRPNQFFFDCETIVEAHVAPPHEVLEFIRTNPDVMFDLLSRVYKGTEGVLSRMLQLMAGSAKGRVLFELVTEYHRAHKANGKDALAIELRESDIAARAGLSRETVSREIKKISEDGSLKVSQREIVIKNLEALEEKLRDSL